MNTKKPFQSEDNPLLPSFDSISELIDFFDTHDMGKYAGQMPEVDFEVSLEREPQQIIFYNSGVSE